LKLCIDGARISAELEKLATFSDAPEPAVTRILWTKPDLDSRAYFIGLCEEAGLSVRQDALGNIFACLEGSDPSLPAIATGSHCDAIPHSGRFDGTVGVFGGLEALRALKQAGFQPRRSLELIFFTSEEPTRFGLGCLGSRAMSGAISVEKLRALEDAEGIDLESARSTAGLRGELESVRLWPGCYEAFVELHIEQGPLLENEGLPLGIVSAIAAPATLRLTIEGEGGHAGARLMPGRRDALLAASELALAVEKAALGTGAIDTVGTTGFFQIHPGAVNSIPSQARVEIDVRDIKGQRRDAVVSQICRSWEEISTRRGVGGTIETLNSDPPATCAANVVEAAQGAAKEVDLPYKDMVSRAYHDALFMASLPDRDDLHSLQRRCQSPSRRVFVSRRNRTRRARFGPHPREASRLKLWNITPWKNTPSRCAATSTSSTTRGANGPSRARRRVGRRFWIVSSSEAGRAALLSQAPCCEKKSRGFSSSMPTRQVRKDRGAPSGA
jgi:ureidoglycolate amidohydrolase